MEASEPKKYLPERFKGGLKLAGHKSISIGEPIRAAALPARAIVPLRQHLGEPAMPCVAVGDRVLRGQPISETQDYVSAELHAPVSGRVVAIEDHPVPASDTPVTRCVIIDADGQDRRYEGYPPLTDYTAAPVATIIERVRAAGIAGLGGAVFPTHVKLNVPPAHPLEALVLNGAECEPYISCDEILMRERAAEVITGAQVMMYALGVNRCLIAIENDKLDALEAMNAALEAEGDDRFELKGVWPIYPTGGERQLIKVLTNLEVPASGLPPNIGYVCQNVGTAVAVKEAILDGNPLIQRIVTVTGPGVKNPANLEVRLGTPLSELIAQCGGYTDEVKLLAMGGSMMGVALASDELPVVKATNCILALTGQELRTGEDVLPCIRCGDCARACPAQLLPQELYWHSRVRHLDRIIEYSVFDCIECGCCDLVCPSHIPLTQYFRTAKHQIWARERRRHAWFGGADSGPRRFEPKDED